jgi:hypothetical protein
LQLAASGWAGRAFRKETERRIHFDIRAPAARSLVQAQPEVRFKSLWAARLRTIGHDFLGRNLRLPPRGAAPLAWRALKHISEGN